MASEGEDRDPADSDGDAPDPDEDVPLLETVARNVPIVLFSLDDEGVFTRSEGRGLSALGLDEHEVVGESVFDVYADHPEIRRAVGRALDGENVNVVHEIGDAAFEAWYRPMGADGVDRILGVAVDVTDRVRHERLLERLNEANRRLLEAESKASIADRIVEIADDVLDQPFTGVWFHDPETGELVWNAGDGPAPEYSRRSMGGDSTEMEVFRSGEARLFEDYGAVEHPAFPDASVGTLLLIPLGEHGLLSIGNPDVVEIEAVERDLIEILARDATVALDRARRERLLERLNEATRALTVAESPGELADRIVEISRGVLDEPASVVWYYDPDAGVLEPVAGTTEESAAGSPARPYTELDPIEPGTAEMDAFMAREPVFFEDYAAVENPAHPETALGAILAVPIDGRGLLTVGAATAEGIGSSTPDLVEILARDAAVALERVDREAAFESLHVATRALMAAETREEIARVTVETTDDVLGHQMAVVRLLSEETGRLEPVARSAYIRENLAPRPSFRPGQGSIGSVFERGEVVLFDRADLDQLDVEGVTQTLLCLPLGGHGVLSIGESEPAAFDDSDVQLAKVLASNVETALDRIDRELELERRNERLDQFAEIVSHDLRNPLNVVSGQVELADIDEERREAIENGVGRMRDIIDDVLALAREGRVVSDPESTDAGQVAKLAWASVETDSATLSVESDLHLLADPERLQHLFENLFRNSVEHGSTGPPSHTREDSVEHGSTSPPSHTREDNAEHGPDDVTVRLGADDGVLFVEDDGPGIPPESRGDVFEAGFSTAEDGSGIGLAIVREIAEAHGWTVSVEEGSHGGARFEIAGVEWR